MSWTAPVTRATGDLISSSDWNAQIVNNMKEVWREIATVANGSDVTVNATTSASATGLVSDSARTYDGNPCVFRATISSVQPEPSALDHEVFIGLFDGTTLIDTFGSVKNTGGTVSGGGIGAPLSGEIRYTPSAASHTFNLRAWGGVTGNTVKATQRLSIWCKGG